MTLYFTNGDSWETDRLTSLRSSERRAWFVAIAAVLVAVLLGFVVAILTPLKRIEPVLQVVDRATGESKTLGLTTTNAAAVRSLTEDEAVRQATLVRYVVAHESYGSRAEIERYFAAIRIFADRVVVEQYEAAYDERNARLGEKGTRHVQVRSVSFLNSSTAAVRWHVIEVDSLGTKAEKDYVSILGFGFVQKPEELSQLWENPLGFKVNKYRADQSAL